LGTNKASSSLQNNVPKHSLGTSKTDKPRFVAPLKLKS
jgi:hypothetical protein